MQTYAVVIDVRRTFTVEIEAASLQDARELGNEMQTTQIYHEGKPGDVETEVIEVYVRE